VLRRSARIRTGVNGANDDELEVVDEPSRQRYEARLGNDVVGFTEYRSVRGRRILFHTEVDPSVEGRGVGSRLAAAALDDIRSRGLKVTVKCPFVAAFIQRHSGYRDLLSG
jgi:predicted GNAT family acetyltransferase